MQVARDPSSTTIKVRGCVTTVTAGSRHGDVQHVDRLIEFSVRRYVDVQAVFDECGVQCVQRIGLPVEGRSEMREHRIGIPIQRIGEMADGHARGKGADVQESRSSNRPLTKTMRWTSASSMR